jgi:hypothetical protein
MKIEPSGVIFTGVCAIQTDRCNARQSGAVTAVWILPGRLQVDVCGACLNEQVQTGEWQRNSGSVERRADIAVYSPGGKLQLMVDVVFNPGCRVPTVEWAIRKRRNLLLHGGIPSSPYLLLAMIPYTFYLWKEDGEIDPDRAPDFEVEIRQVLQPYVARLTPPPYRVNERQMGEAIAAWLKDVAAAEPSADVSLSWLYESGLYEALKDSSVEMETAIAA